MYKYALIILRRDVDAKESDGQLRQYAPHAIAHRKPPLSAHPLARRSRNRQARLIGPAVSRVPDERILPTHPPTEVALQAPIGPCTMTRSNSTLRQLYSDGASFNNLELASSQEHLLKICFSHSHTTLRATMLSVARETDRPDGNRNISSAFWPTKQLSRNSFPAIEIFLKIEQVF